MSIQKHSILAVNYDINKGLKLAWDFKELFLQEKYFRHLFIVYSADSEFSKDFIEQYCKRIKNGDFFACIYMSQSHKVKFNGWFEKTMLSDVNYRKLAKHGNLVANRDDLLRRASKQTEIYNQPVLINIILDDPQEKQKFTERIAQYRANNLLSYVVSFFGPFNANSVSISKGINYFQLTSANMIDVIAFSLGFFHQAALYHASLTIQCQNGQLISSDTANWKGIEFDKIKRQFYGPSLAYAQDLVIFLNQGTHKSILYNLNIHLEFKSFSKICYRSDKRVKISVVNDRMHLRTITNRKHPNKQFPLSKEMEVVENPYCSETYVIYRKNVESEDA